MVVQSRVTVTSNSYIALPGQRFLLLLMAFLAVVLLTYSSAQGFMQHSAQIFSAAGSSSPAKHAEIQVDGGFSPSPRASQVAESLKALTLVSFNIAGCQPSQSAPSNWTVEMAAEAITNDILQKDPDILCLQECPGDEVWAMARFLGYNVLGVRPSHADNVILLVRKGISAEPVPMEDVPAVMARLTVRDHALLVASVHLAPFSEGQGERLLQMQTLTNRAKKGSLPLIIAGDTNMRVQEDNSMEGTLKLLDLWKAAGSDPATRFTWDTVNHGESFNRYYGDTTREYTARYDRIYASSLSMKLSVTSFELIANHPVTSKFHFLSDHFGLATAFRMEKERQAL